MVLSPYLVVSWCEDTKVGDDARALRIFNIVDRAKNYDDVAPIVGKMLDWHWASEVIY